MIKDNHVEASGGIREAIQAVSDYKVAHRLNLPLTVEVRTMDELQEAMEVGGFQRVMLDNFDVREMADAVAYIDGKCEVEASGGITLESLRSVAETGVDFISTGALTHSSKSLDLSLKIIKSS
jgi:nicotinate-nucleotide pyrophosphorylase (carboxylating)